MKQREVNKLWQRFHAGTFASIGETEPIFKATLTFAKKNLGLPKGEKVILLFVNELKEMANQKCAYFEFADKDVDTGAFKPYSETRDLYKWVHNGFPFECVIKDPDTENRNDWYYLPIDNLEKIMDYPIYKEPEFNVEGPVTNVTNVTNPQISLTDAFDKPVEYVTNKLPLDTPLSDVTLGQFLEALKSLK